MSNQHKFTPPEEYKDIFDLIISHKGVIFGGAVRDIIRNERINDIDVSIPDDNCQDFYEELIYLGYNEIEQFSNKFHKDNIIIDVCENSLVDGATVNINLPPDFDVNCLAWDGDKLYDFWDPEWDVSGIIHNIKEKHAEKIKPTQKRIDHMLSKGWVLNERKEY